MGTQFLFEKIKNSGNSGDGCTLWMYLMSLNGTLKMVRMVNFMLCVFPTNKIVW